MADMLIIGIAGGSGSGKSTIARLIAEKFGDDVTVLRHDDYYKGSMTSRLRSAPGRTTTARRRLTRR